MRSPFFLNLFSTDLSVVLYAVAPSAPLPFPRVCVCVCLCDRMKCETFLGDILYRIFLFLIFVSLSFLCFHLEAHQQLSPPPLFLSLLSLALTLGHS